MITLWMLAILLAVSCTVPKRYQKNKPFVYKTTIHLNGNLPTKDRVALKDRLYNQLDDSLKVRTVVAIRAIPPFFYNRLSRPPVFDSIYIGRSKTFMSALLNSQGYFSPMISDTFMIDTVGDQYRVKIDFSVIPGEVLRIDSIGYDIQNEELQQLALANEDKSILKKNDPYSLQNVSSELDRLMNIYRNNGYYRISKEDLYAEHDTVASALLDPTLDPFEQLRLLDSLQRTSGNPTVSITIKQRIIDDSSHLEKFYIGDVTVYPDLPLLLDTVGLQQDSSIINGIRFYYNTQRFKLPFIARNILLRKGNLYRNDDYFKTINTFTNLGAWQQVDIDLQEKSDSSRVIDAFIKLYPAKKRRLNIDFETSRNVIDIISIGSLFGTGLNLGINNRNAFRESIQTSSNLRLGVELGRNFIQTVQTSFSHSIYIPRFIIPFKKFKNRKSIISPKTIVNLNAAYTDRREYFDVRSVNASWGYEGSRRNHSWQWIPLNFELTNVGKTDSFLRDEQRIPNLKYAFNDGMIMSQILTYGTAKRTGGKSSFFRARVESSGAIFGMIEKLDRKDLQRFIKADVEYKYFSENPGSTWAFRVFGGYGYSYGKSGDTSENSLPFFKAYFGGGPYSMRAWRVRQLGLGSNTTFGSSGSQIPRYGDIQLEGNIEYRFDIGSVFGVKVQSALFTDMGNIWLRNTGNNDNLKGAEFRLNRLYKDLAIAAGTSIRLDFDFFLIRFDWAYKIKDPFYSNLKNGWFQSLRVQDGQFQLGIGYPF